MSTNKSMWNKGEKIFCKDNSNFGRLFNQFSLMSLNRFIWEGLPENISSYHIEKGLFDNGQVAFYDDEMLGLLCLPCSSSSNLNVYGDPTQLTLTGIGYSETIDVDKTVRIKSNDLCSPNILQVSYYAGMLDEIETTIYLNLDQQRFPYIIPVTKDNEFSMKALYKKMQNGEKAIFVDSKFSSGGDPGITVLETKVPYLLDKLQITKEDTINELLTFLGFNNSNNKNKKERLIVDEVNVNNSHILMNLEIEYKNRLKACEEINKKFNLNISVKKVIDELESNFVGKMKEE